MKKLFKRKLVCFFLVFTALFLLVFNFFIIPSKAFLCVNGVPLFSSSSGQYGRTMELPWVIKTSKTNFYITEPDKLLYPLVEFDYNRALNLFPRQTSHVL